MESAYSLGPMPVISLLDNDLYSFTQQQPILHQHPDVDVEYELIVRSKEDLTPYIGAVRKALEALSEKSFTEDELRFLARQDKREYIKPDFIRFLGLFKFNLHYVTVSHCDGQLAIRVRGPWLHCILFEIPILSMVSEIRNRHKYPDVSLTDVTSRLYEKFDWLATNATNDELALMRVADFGTRRRLSYKAQFEMIGVMKRDFPGVFVGTSNVHMAREFDIDAIGTMSHQWLMAHQQLGRLHESQAAALEGWVKEYRGRLGIALTDCISSDWFLSEFDHYFVKLFDGVRHDSGDPLVWAEKFIAHYKKMGIDPMTKSLVFSDALDVKISLKIIRALQGRIRFSFGIGTNLSCDVADVTPLSIVMKLVKVNDRPVVKFSDEPTKLVCRDKSFEAYARTTFRIA